MTRGPRKPSGDYEVGYCKPPVATQFRKGQSGNPSGRRKGRPSLADLVHRELNSKTSLNENGAWIKVTKREAVAKRLVLKAAKGDRSALKEIISMDQQARVSHVLEQPITFTLKLEED